MSILVTGSAGFIGFHLCKKLIEANFEVIGFDNMNSYYDVNLKSNRIKELKRLAKKNKVPFDFILGDLTSNSDLDKVFTYQDSCNIKTPKKDILYVINLA